MTGRRVTAFATQGAGGNEEARLLALLGRFAPTVLPFDRRRKRRMFLAILRHARRERPDLLVMEGTGLAGGLALILARLLFGVRYVVSSGDAVGPWVGSRVRPLGPAFGAYERVLCRLAAGFVGWTPYLVGRAVTFGCRRAVTAPGWAPFPPPADPPAAPPRVRRNLGIGDDELVVGIAGSLAWSARRRYCYGLELAAAARHVRRPGVRFLVVGDGPGRPHLDRLAAAAPPGRVLFAGRRPQAELPDWYAAMDLASLPQSTDAVGAVRYTTKLSEYLAAGLGVTVGPVPMAYDLDAGWAWRVPGGEPWEPGYHRALAALIDALTPAEIAAKAAAARAAAGLFDRDRQVDRVTAFLSDLLADR